jgi:hypothetical protein
MEQAPEFTDPFWCAAAAPFASGSRKLLLLQ